MKLFLWSLAGGVGVAGLFLIVFAIGQFIDERRQERNARERFFERRSKRFHDLNGHRRTIKTNRPTQDERSNMLLRAPYN